MADRLCGRLQSDTVGFDSQSPLLSDENGIKTFQYDDKRERNSQTYIQ